MNNKTPQGLLKEDKLDLTKREGLVRTRTENYLKAELKKW